jgi:hypothetical protein
VQTSRLGLDQGSDIAFRSMTDRNVRCLDMSTPSNDTSRRRVAGP